MNKNEKIFEKYAAVSLQIRRIQSPQRNIENNRHSKTERIHRDPLPRCTLTLKFLLKDLKG